MGKRATFRMIVVAVIASTALPVTAGPALAVSAASNAPGSAASRVQLPKPRVIAIDGG